MLLKSLIVFVAGLVGVYCKPLSSSNSYSVSGLSSGAFFAVQYGVAFSSEVTGVGVVAGGPYYCAKGSEVNALEGCMIMPEAIDIETLYTDTKTFATQNKIDDPSNIANQKVYLYSGTRDTVVYSGVVSKCQQYYQKLGATTQFQNNISSEHAMITNFYGSNCAILGEPYINNCNYDLAGVILKYIYGPLSSPVNPKNVPYNNVKQIQQSKFLPSGKTITEASLQSIAYYYAATGCDIAPLTSGCTLHIVFHGCEQDLNSMITFTTQFNDTYVRNTGYNEWAETNKMVILYPQANKNELEGNPDGCWDWWGYAGSDYSFKTGVQMATVYNMAHYILG